MEILEKEEPQHLPFPDLSVSWDLLPFRRGEMK
jgi:hypothetical protein